MVAIDAFGRTKTYQTVPKPRQWMSLGRFQTISSRNMNLLEQGKFSMFSQTLNSRLPPRMPPIGLKLGQNAFQTIPNISFFDPEKKFGEIVTALL